MSDLERIFNLQLTIQKLEEELSLYRNGTNGQELMEYINEKEWEIEDLKKKLEEKTESLRKIAISSSEVLAQSEQLHKQNALYAQKISELEARAAGFQTNIEELKREITIVNDEKKEMEQQAKEKIEAISKLEFEIIERNDNIDRLQQRCAALVLEKTEKSKLLEKEKVDRSRQVKEIRVSQNFVIFFLKRKQFIKYYIKY